MPKKLNLKNYSFGQLTVLEEAAPIITPNGRKHTAWKCKCSCGNTIIVRTDNLRNGHTVSCGCKKQKVLASAGQNRSSKLENQRFGHLIVLEDSKKRDTKGGIIWKCQCDCGNLTYVSTSNLKRKTNATISCGCLKSKGEDKIIQILIKNQIPFIYQKTFDDCINPDTKHHFFFDFYLPTYDLLIEYDGEQHFQETHNFFNSDDIKKRDNYKNEWCQKNNKKLVRIPYIDYDKIDFNYIKQIIN